MQISTVKCSYCGIMFSRKTKELEFTLRRGCKVHCSRKCADLDSRILPETRVCKQCGLSFSRVKKGKDTLTFCSRTCSSKFVSISTAPRRRKIKKCLNCSSVFHGSKKLCSMCAPKRTKLSVALGFTKKDKDFARICREHARNSLKKTNGLKSCSICGFSEFVEACHILPVKDFELDVPIRVINHPSNLVGLCPNCHWCYDHGKLSLPKN